ncbi:MAG: hypothetical protein GX558_00945 [Clostridiales bacterium]|nr:hypothetical protein [Clostridiales bacterium]
MKRICALTLLALLCALPALAAPGLDDGLIDRGREVMNLASYGEFERAFKVGGFREDSADDFALYMQDNFYDLFNGTLQQDVAVCYYDGGTWTLAIPVLDPNDDNAETMLLTAADGRHFDGYGAVRWGDAVAAADAAEEVVWRGDYASGSVIVEPDQGWYGDGDEEDGDDENGSAAFDEPADEIIAESDA